MTVVARNLVYFVAAMLCLVMQLGCSDDSPDAAAQPAVSLTGAEGVAADAPASPSNDSAASSSTTSKPAEADEEAEVEPWDFSPYKVLVWIVSDDPRVNAESVRQPLQEFLDRDFAAVWRLDFADAPAAVANAASRNLGEMTYEAITASDPVVAVKRDHEDAVRLRTAANVGEIIQDVHSTQGMIDEVRRRAADAGDVSMDGVNDRLLPVDGDAIAVSKMWENPATEAILVSRGMALLLDDPEAKIIPLPLSGLVIEAIDSYDKIFVVRIDEDVAPATVSVVEIDTLMRHFGPVATQNFVQPSEMASTIGRTMIEAFAPVVRIEDAGKKNAKG
ncbi:signal peptide protein, partial [Rhodopirellula maiorica SM1]